MIYSLLYYHAKSNSYIRMGEDCAAKLDRGGTREISAFRKAVRAYEEAQAGKKMRYGNISEKEIAFIDSLLNRIENRAVIAARRAVQSEAAAPCPAGRIVVTAKSCPLVERTPRLVTSSRCSCVMIPALRCDAPAPAPQALPRAIASR
jgi:hypothetical protein